MRIIILQLHVLFLVIESGRRFVTEQHRSVSLDALAEVIDNGVDCCSSFSCILFTTMPIGYR